MRFRTIALALAALPVVLGGCGGTGTPGISPSGSAPASPAVPWVIVATGSATPSPTPSVSFSLPPSGLPTISLPAASACAIAWPEHEQVLIPMIVTPGKASLKVQWPARYGPNYRVAAVDQRLVSGTQPPPTWVNVTAGSGCTVTATLTGLISGNPYIVWLDAPNTPRNLDGSRSLYSGKSGVVTPL
jgi:hypothetical protein